MGSYRIFMILCLLLDSMRLRVLGNDPNTDLLTVVRNLQKEVKDLTRYIHQRDEKVDEKIEQLQDKILGVKEDAKLSRTLITSGLGVISASSSSVLGGLTDLFGPRYAWKGLSAIAQNFFHSEINEMNPWLLIQIPRVQLFSVTIINRIDCCGERLHNLQVRAGLSKGVGNEVVGTFKGPGESGKVYVIPFTKGVVAEYISFQIQGKGTLQINGIRVNQGI